MRQKKRVMLFLRHTIASFSSTTISNLLIRVFDYFYRLTGFVPNWRIRYMISIMPKARPLTAFKYYSIPDIDVIVPLALKDIDTVDLSVYAAKKNLINKVTAIKIIYSDVATLEKIQHLSSIKIYENEFLGIRINEALSKISDMKKRGWIKQQVIKFKGVLDSEREASFILDSDTILLEPRIPIILRKDKGFLQELNISHEYYKPYLSFSETYLGMQIRSPFHYICHFQLMQKKILREIFPNGDSSLVYMIEMLNSFETLDALSEYQIYGCYLKGRHMKNLAFGKWNNVSSSDLPKLSESLGIEAYYKIVKDKFQYYDSVSFHGYLRNG